LQPVLVPVAVIALVTTPMVMASAGHAAQWVLKRERGQKHD